MMRAAVVLKEVVGNSSESVMVAVISQCFHSSPSRVRARLTFQKAVAGQSVLEKANLTNQFNSRSHRVLPFREFQKVDLKYLTLIQIYRKWNQIKFHHWQ